MTAQWIVFDYETASATNLKKSGAWVYAECPTTEILCLSYSVNGAKALTWLPGQPIPEIWVQAIEAGWWFVAFNAQFEKAIYKNIQMPVFFWPEIPDDQFHDVQAVCAMKNIPLDLDRTALVLRLNAQKDAEGSKFTIGLSKPNKKGQYDRSQQAILRVVAYCEQDIVTETSAHRRLGWLPPGERKVWLLNQKINQRGLRIDLAFVRKAQEIVDKASKPLLAEFATITGGLKPGQRDKFLAWMDGQGVKLPNLQKEYMTELLGENVDETDDTNAEDFGPDPGAYYPVLPDHIRRVLVIRALVGSTSIKKLERMVECTCADGRAKGLLQYHGTGPGRSAGRLFQPHNFPRGTIKTTPAKIVEAIMTGDPNYLELTVGPAIECIVSALRHALVPDPDRIFLAGDYAGIQARTVLAVAGQHDKTALMADGADIYCDMARQIYKVPVDKKKDPEKRQVGKNCLGASTLVLTRRGLHPITEVLATDQVWDGIEWVNHQGLLAKGLRQTISLLGVTVTPEHPVLCGGQWLRSDFLARDERACFRALVTGLENFGFLATNMEAGEGFYKSLFNAHVGRLPMVLKNIICGTKSPLVVTNAQKPKLGTGVRNFMGTLMLCLTKLTGSAFSTGSVQFSAGVITRRTNTFPTTGNAELLFGQSGEKIGRLSSRTLPLWKVGTFQSWSWTERKLMMVMSRVISGLSPRKLTLATNDKSQSCNEGSLSWKPVFDLANAGPRNRFTIWTNRGPLIVHNSVLGLGFQMGAKKFQFKYGRYKEDGHTLCHPIEFCETVVHTYRKEWAPKVPYVWYGLQDAATKAVWSQKPQEAYGVEYRLENGWLSARLPSGRKIWYFNPKPIKKAMPWNKDDIREAFQFNAMKMGQWKTIDAFGGQLTENVVMGIERDLMTCAMLKCEENGMPVVLEVHDEIIVEPLKVDADEKAFEQIMLDVPDWCRQIQIPVAVETWQGDRYKK